MLDSYASTLRGLILLGWPERPTRISVRIVFISISAVGFMLYLQWEAMLISYLSARRTLMPFQDVESLLRNTDYQIYVRVIIVHKDIENQLYKIIFQTHPGMYTLDDFRSSPDPIMQKAWKERLEPNMDDMKKYSKCNEIFYHDIFYRSFALLQYLMDCRFREFHWRSPKQLCTTFLHQLSK